jgi:hypothetical protein
LKLTVNLTPERVDVLQERWPGVKLRRALLNAVDALSGGSPPTAVAPLLCERCERVGIACCLECRRRGKRRQRPAPAAPSLCERCQRVGIACCEECRGV